MGVLPAIERKVDGDSSAPAMELESTPGWEQLHVVEVPADEVITGVLVTFSKDTELSPPTVSRGMLTISLRKPAEVTLQVALYDKEGTRVPALVSSADMPEAFLALFGPDVKNVGFVSVEAAPLGTPRVGDPSANLPLPGQGEPAGPRFEVGKKCPPIETSAVGGRTYRSTDHAGKVTILDFWGVHCPPCVAATNQLENLTRELAADGTNPADRLVVVTFCVDFPQFRELAEKKIRTFPESWYNVGKLEHQARDLLFAASRPGELMPLPILYAILPDGTFERLPVDPNDLDRRIRGWLSSQTAK